MTSDASFNTTLVTVQFTKQKKSYVNDPWFQYNPCYCSIDAIMKKLERVGLFQYNPCYCSILYYLKIPIKLPSFNTTLVTVQLLPLLGFRFRLSGFNTTLVTVQLYCYHNISIEA